MISKPLSVGEHHRYKKHPYYIYTPPYTEKSAGIRVLHYLCNILNISGHEAYINTPITNPLLWTPTLTNDVLVRHFSGQKKPIVIYPEVVVGTPLNMGIPVRYFLNQAGKIAGHTNFGKNEIQISYRNAFSDDAETPLLTIPCSDPSVFYPPPPGTQREGRYFYFSRLLARGGELQDITHGVTEISSRNPMPLEDLPELFRRAELLYCYEDGAITLEARMCGCPIVYIPNPTSLPEFPQEDWGTMGAAWGASPEQIEHAKSTVDQVYPAALELYNTFAEQLQQFIQLTQSAAQHTPWEECYASLLKPALRDNQREMAWLKAHEMQEADGQIWAERMLSTWSHQPTFHVFIIATEESQKQLTNTLEDLSKSLYPHWKVTIISDYPAPSGWQESPQHQWLALRNIEDADYVLNEMAAVTASDWMTEIHPGVAVKPFALLMAADYINHHPEWQLFDADELVPEAPSEAPSLRMNTAFDLDFLREHNHLGGCVMVRQQAWRDVGRYGNLPMARSYDLALKIHDRFGSPALGHIPHVLSERRGGPVTELARTQELRALADHLSRSGIHADIQQGPDPHTRHLSLAKTDTTRGVTFVVPIGQVWEMHHPTAVALARCADSEVLLANISGQVLELPPALTAPGTRVRLVTATHDHWPQEAAQQAKLDLLFFISPCTSAPTAQDVATLRHTLEHTRAALVTPALCDSDANTPLNVHDWPNAAAVANPVKQRCTHGKLAVTGLPLLVRRDVMLQQGGWDLARYTLTDALIDFSARLAASSQKMVWTPHVALHRPHPATETNEADGAFAALSRRRLMDAHLGHLSQAAGFHPDLLLQTPQAIRHQQPLTWNAHANERPKVLVLDAPKDASDPFLVWLDRLRETASAVVLAIDRHDTPLDVLTIARLAPHVIVMNASPASGALTLMHEVSTLLPQVCITVNIDRLEWASDAERNCPDYMQQVLERCTAGASHLISLASTHGTAAPMLAQAVERLDADSPVPRRWTIHTVAPIAQ